MTNESGGQILVRGLRALGADTVFCVPGESYLAALDAFYDARDSIRLITCRQEGGATYMAEAAGKLSGRPGVCFVTRGPGATNAMIGMHTAFQDSTPLLLCVGQVARAHLGREAFQELDYAKVYAGVVKRVFTAMRADEVAAQLYAAWDCAINARPGPVVLVLPEDMLRERAEVTELPAPKIKAIAPAPQAMQDFAELLHASERPLVICGGAGWNAKCNDLLQQLSDKHALPVATAFRRQDSFDNRHAHYVGEFGIAPDPKLVAFARDADLIIALAARLGEITTAGYTLFPAPEFDDEGKRKLAHIYVDANELNSVYRADAAVASHPEDFLRAALALPVKTKRDSARIQTAREAHQSYVAAPRHVGAKLRMDMVTAWLREQLPRDTIITNGAGNCTVWAQRHMTFREFGRQLAPTNGSMGYGVPAAIAAKLLRPEALVLSFSGDGCFLMNGQELSTAMRYQLGVIFFVINNASYGTIRAHQERDYPDRPIATDLTNPDFAQLAKAHGAFGECVSETAAFAPAFTRAHEWCKRERKPALLELRVED